MADIKTKTTMEEFITEDQSNYYFGIPSITVNDKNDYELKGKFLDDLRDNAFSGTNREDVIEHIEYFFKIVDPINLPNSDNKEGVINDGFSKLEKANNDDEREISEVDPELFTYDIERTKTYEDYEYESNNDLDEPWPEDGVPYEISSRLLMEVNDHECSLFANWRDHIRGPYANFITTNDPYLDINQIFSRNGEASYNSENQYEKKQHEERYELFKDTTHDAPVCKIRIFEMIKYSFGQDEEYVAIKECEYVDSTRTNEDACRAYQEIFRYMDEG
ncbi:hypothetical protein Tco_1171876 [Tanacetum coccineum]